MSFGHINPRGQAFINAEVTAASSGTVDLGQLASNVVSITGTTTITSFGSSATLINPIYLLRFTGALTFTHNGTSLILPGSANITTAAGDTAVLQYMDAGNWKCLSYTRATGLPFVTTSLATGGTGATSLTNHGVVTAGASALTTVAPGASGNLLTSNGTDWASTAPAASATTALGLNTGTASINVAASDQNKVVELTGTTARTFTLLNAATLGSNWWCYLKNSSTAVLTLATTSSEQVDGLTTFPIYPGELRLIRSDGSSAFTSYVINGFVYKVTATGATTFTKPPGYSATRVQVWGGGASGGTTTATTTRGGGGGGGSYSEGFFPMTLLGATVTVTVGAGGAAIGTSTLSDGNIGANTTFGTLLTGYGGGRGGGAAAANNAGGGGAASGIFGNNGALGGNATGTTGGAGGSSTPALTANTMMAGGAAGSTPGDGFYGGGGGTSGSGTVAAQSIWGGGGGAGAQATSGNTGIAGGNSQYGGAGGGGAAGTGTISPAGTSVFGGAGGQGGNNSTTPTDGSQPGGGGGGGSNNKASGKGGDGQCTIYGLI